MEDYYIPFLQFHKCPSSFSMLDLNSLQIVPYLRISLWGTSSLRYLIYGH